MLKIISGFVSDDPIFMEAVSSYCEEMATNGWLRYESRIIYGLQNGLIQRFFAYEYEKQIVSFLAFEQYDLAKNIEIIGAWTHTDYRRKGFYDALFQRLVKTYIKKKYRTISSGFYHTNITSKQMQEKQGREIGPLKENGFHHSIYHLENSYEY